MSESVVRKCGPWTVVLRQSQDTTLPWRADASLHFDHEFAEGLDAEQALTTVALKIGAAPADLLREFGLQ